jgi:hypothetical protein
MLELLATALRKIDMRSRVTMRAFETEEESSGNATSELSSIPNTSKPQQSLSPKLLQAPVLTELSRIPGVCMFQDGHIHQGS